jgi:hypothetical protein
VEFSNINQQITKDSTEISRVINTAINKKVATEGSRQHEKPSALQQEAALGALASKNDAVFTVSLLIPAFLVAVLILPLVMSSLMPPTAYDSLVDQEVDEHVQAIETEWNAMVRKDLANVTQQLAGQVTDLVERLPRFLAETPSADITEVLRSLTRVQKHLSELTVAHSAEPTGSARRWRPLPNIGRRNRTG